MKRSLIILLIPFLYSCAKSYECTTVYTDSSGAAAISYVNKVTYLEDVSKDHAEEYEKNGTGTIADLNINQTTTCEEN